MERVNYVYLFIALMCQSASVIFGKMASISNAINDVPHIVTNKYYIISLFFLLLQAISWQKVLRKLPLFFSYMFMNGIYPIVLFSSFFIFKEQIYFYNLIGIIIIITGLIIFNFGSQK